MNMSTQLIIGIMAGFDVLVAVGAFILYRRNVKRYQKEQEEKADNIIKLANEKVREAEVEAKDKSLAILQAAEDEVARRRSELSNEEERLQKRRADLDRRMDRAEQRENVIS